MTAIIMRTVKATKKIIIMMKMVSVITRNKEKGKK